MVKKGVNYEIWKDNLSRRVIRDKGKIKTYKIVNIERFPKKIKLRFIEEKGSTFFLLIRNNFLIRKNFKTISHKTINSKRIKIENYRKAFNTGEPEEKQISFEQALKRYKISVKFLGRRKKFSEESAIESINNSPVIIENVFRRLRRFKRLKLKLSKKQSKFVQKIKKRR